MRFYRARDLLNVTPGQATPEMIYKGQLFFVDSPLDLPAYNNDKQVNQYWEELELHNNYGRITLRSKP